jgi:hypothetical protein
MEKNENMEKTENMENNDQKQVSEVDSATNNSVDISSLLPPETAEKEQKKRKKDTRGRHKKNCNCELCVEKRRNLFNPLENDADSDADKVVDMQGVAMEPTPEQVAAMEGTVDALLDGVSCGVGDYFAGVARRKKLGEEWVEKAAEISRMSTFEKSQFKAEMMKMLDDYPYLASNLSLLSLVAAVVSYGIRLKKFHADLEAL